MLKEWQQNLLFPAGKKGSASKMYNKGMGGVDLIDQRSAVYHLDRKSTIRFPETLWY